MAEIEPRQLRVIVDVRAWANVRTQKMGWLRPGDVVEIFELYKGYVQFRPVEGGEDLILLNSDYTQYWIEPNMEDRFENVDVVPVPDPDPLPEPDPDPILPPIPVPSNPGDAELGAAFRLIVDFILRR